MRLNYTPESTAGRLLLYAKDMNDTPKLPTTHPHREQVHGHVEQAPMRPELCRGNTSQRQWQA